LGTTKPFSKKLHEENDELAKKKMIEVLESWGYSAIRNPKRYEIDVLADGDNTNSKVVDLGIKFGVETEIKHPWKGENFPFEDLNIPSRKFKLLSGNAYFGVFNSDLTKLAMVHSDYVALSPQKEVSNRLVKEGETFFKVPLENVSFYSV